MLRSLWLRIRGRSYQEDTAELAAHYEQIRERLIDQGLSPEDASASARRQFGNPTSLQEQSREMFSVPFLDHLCRDIHYAVRNLGRTPGFTVVAILTIALGIGATTAIFTVINGVLIKPLPYPDADSLVAVWHSAVLAGAVRHNVNHSASMYVAYAENNRTFQEYGVWNNGASSVTGAGDPEQVRTFRVTYGVLRAFGVQPQLGRWFSEADDSPATPETVLLMHGYWQRRFGGDPSILGRSITIDSRPRVVIGVMPQSFQLNGNPEIILPLRFNRAELQPTFAFVGIARLRPGVSLAQSNADLERMLPIWISRYGMQRFASLKLGGAIRPFKEDVVGDISNVLWILMAVIGIVLLIACANVASLILVRTVGRQHELAIRAALGAGRGRIARELLVESLAFGALGGAAGLALAFGAIRVLRTIGPVTLPRLSEIYIDPVVLLFTGAVSLVSGLFFGAIPVLKFSRPSLRGRLGGMLPGGSRGNTQSREHHRSQRALVVVQVALALVLLIGSGLMIRTFQALRSVDPGFSRPERIQTIRLAIPPTQVPEPEGVTRMQQAILDKLSAIPGVESAAFMDGLPMDRNAQSSSPVSVEGQPDTGGLPPVRRVKFISPGLFQTLGTRLIGGRDFTWREIYAKSEVALVSENFARETWGDPRAALGKRIREGTGGPWREIIGVVADLYDEGAHRPPPAIVYWPARVQVASMGVQRYIPRSMAFAIRSNRTGMERFLPQIQEAVWSVNPTLPLAEVQTLADVSRKPVAQMSFTLVMLAMAGGMALALSLIGIYGVLSYSVSCRVREIGIRLALGVEPGALRRMFVRQGLILAAIGVAIGLPAAAALTRLLESFLFRVGALDFLTYASVPLALLLTAVLASYFPARRAGAIDPVKALRSE
ncbi:MAG TPA: ABC transporter permease [Bryobacteraceae bacterium]|nr:ABC transporter permease [Bryobacteraceae bacterium]